MMSWSVSHNPLSLRSAAVCARLVSVRSSFPLLSTSHWWSDRPQSAALQSYHRRTPQSGCAYPRRGLGACLATSQSTVGNSSWIMGVGGGWYASSHGPLLPIPCKNLSFYPLTTLSIPPSRKGQRAKQTRASASALRAWASPSSHPFLTAQPIFRWLLSGSFPIFCFGGRGAFYCNLQCIIIYDDGVISKKSMRMLQSITQSPEKKSFPSYWLPMCIERTRAFF